MKHKITHFLLAITVLVGTTFAQVPQSAESDAETYKAYLSTDITAAKEVWKKIVRERQTAFDANPKDKTLRYRLALAQYGLLSYTMRDRDEDLFDDYADALEEHLEALLEDDKKWAEPKALLGGLYGMKISYSPMKGMYYGPKSSSLLEEAVKDSPKSALAWKLYANSKLFTPEMWGGDINEAIRAYKKSIQLYESQKETSAHNWFYIDAYAFLGQAYLKNKDKANAIATYEKVLAIEPDYHWVKNVLLPEAKK